MKTSKTGKAICTHCRRLATGEGNVHLSNDRLGCLTYCRVHADNVRDFKPLNYYRDHFSFIDQVCEQENVYPLQLCKHPVTDERIPFALVACSLLNEHDMNCEQLRRWLQSIAGQPGCVKFRREVRFLQLSK
jgi:hypothetical protein